MHDIRSSRSHKIPEEPLVQYLKMGRQGVRQPERARVPNDGDPMRVALVDDRPEPVVFADDDDDFSLGGGAAPWDVIQ